MDENRAHGREPRKRLLGEVGYGLFTFILIVVVVTLVFSVAKRKPYLQAGLLIGAIYVLVAVYYFYDQFLVPYLKELGRGNREFASIYSPNIYAWMAQWLFPATAVLLFVILGFSITIDKCPLKGNIFTSPYHYGLVYKKFHQKVSNIEPLANADDNELKARQIVIVRTFAPYLKKRNAKGEPTLEYYDIERSIYSIPFMIALAFGFLGTLIYTLKDMAHRFFTLDLYPKTYVSYVIRFIFAPSLCIVIAYFIMNDWPVNSAPILFFLIGFFPQTALQYIEEKARQVLKVRKEQKTVISLEMIQGMTDYTLSRLRELGIEDVQNLANVDLTYLRRNLGFSNRALADLVSQAILVLHFTENLDKLRSFGIRDILSFQTAVTQNSYQNVANATSITPDKLAGFMSLMESDAMKGRAETLAYLKCETDKKEADHLKDIQCT